MKLGVFTVPFGAEPLEVALDRAVGAGLDCVGIGFRKGVAFLRNVMPVEPAMTDAWRI